MVDDDKQLMVRQPNKKDIAVLMMSLGEEGAARVMSHLSQRELHDVSASMAEIEPLRRQQIQEVLGMFLHTYRFESGVTGSSKGYLDKTLKMALGEQEAKTVMESIFGEESSSLDHVRWMDSGTIAEVITAEHPQLQAVVLAYLEPEQAAEVLQRLPSQSHEDLLSRVAQVEELHPSVLQELAVMFDDNTGLLNKGRNTSVSGMKQVADIMNQMGESRVQQLLKFFKRQDKQMADMIEQQMFVFDYLVRLEEDALTKVVAESSPDVLALALKGADSRVMDAFMATMTNRAARFLQEDIKNLGAVRASQVKEAQREMVELAKMLGDDGQINLNFNASDEMID